MKYNAIVSYSLNEKIPPADGYWVKVEYDYKDLTDEQILDLAKEKIVWHPKINNSGIKEIEILKRDGEPKV